MVEGDYKGMPTLKKGKKAPTPGPSGSGWYEVFLRLTGLIGLGLKVLAISREFGGPSIYNNKVHGPLVPKP